MLNFAAFGGMHFEIIFDRWVFGGGDAEVTWGERPNVTIRGNKLDLARVNAGYITGVTAGGGVDTDDEIVNGEGRS